MNNELSKQEKLAKKTLEKISNKVRADFSFHKIRNLNDYFHSLGYSDSEILNTLQYRSNELSQPINFKQVKDRLDDLRISLETEYWLKYNPPSLNGQDNISD